MYKDSVTGSEYMRYNKTFQRWFTSLYGKAKVTERHAREFVQTFIKDGKSTQVLVAALKFRFNECEKKGFSFKGLIKATENSKSHNYISPSTRQLIDDSLVGNLEMRLACRILYDLGAMIQDLTQFKYGCFEQTNDGARIEYTQKKTAKKKLTRLGIITKETYSLLKA